MKHSNSVNNINAIKEFGRLFNEFRSNLSSNETKELEENSTKMKLPVSFLKKKSKMVL